MQEELLVMMQEIDDREASIGNRTRMDRLKDAVNQCNALRDAAEPKLNELLSNFEAAMRDAEGFTAFLR